MVHVRRPAIQSENAREPDAGAEKAACEGNHPVKASPGAHRTSMISHRPFFLPSNRSQGLMVGDEFARVPRIGQLRCLGGKAPDRVACSLPPPRSHGLPRASAPA